MARLLLLLLISVTLMVHVLSTQSHRPPEGNYRTPVNCGDCMSTAYGCWAVDNDFYSSCQDCNVHITVYAKCENGVLTDNIACGNGLVWDDSTKTCQTTSSCPTSDTCNGYTPPSCGTCIDNCNGVNDDDYISCKGNNVYASCSGAVLYDNRPCPATLVWDDQNKRCEYQSSCA